ncbi:EF-hand domain-containing protein [Novilysobacter erysipheiresistens]|uniref:EF-hand domain-containing protein n=1 Tax=Novilysobacter erysipheiresistens TaxID=1749332 RepID=A0ABU7YZ50_9GAMM
MNKLSRSTLAFAFVASLAAPLAFAQDASTDVGTDVGTDAAAQAAPTEQMADPAAAAPQALSWNDVDADKDGALSQAEAGSVPELVTVFADADADADGSLTADEYQAYVAKVQAEGSAGSGG